MKKQINNMIQEWHVELDQLHDELMEKGSESHAVEYNILATEALRLSRCISDAQELLMVTD